MKLFKIQNCQNPDEICWAKNRKDLMQKLGISKPTVSRLMSRIYRGEIVNVRHFIVSEVEVEVTEVRHD